MPKHPRATIIATCFWFAVRGTLLGMLAAYFLKGPPDVVGLEVIVGPAVLLSVTHLSVPALLKKRTLTLGFALAAVCSLVQVPLAVLLHTHWPAYLFVAALCGAFSFSWLSKDGTTILAGAGYAVCGMLFLDGAVRLDEIYRPWGILDLREPIVLAAGPAMGLFVGIPVALVSRWRNAVYAPDAGQCRNCGYNLTGNTSGMCPECGTKI